MREKKSPLSNDGYTQHRTASTSIITYIIRIYEIWPQINTNLITDMEYHCAIRSVQLSVAHSKCCISVHLRKFHYTFLRSILCFPTNDSAFRACSDLCVLIMRCGKRQVVRHQSEIVHSSKLSSIYWHLPWFFLFAADAAGAVVA